MATSLHFTSMLVWLTAASAKVSDVTTMTSTQATESPFKQTGSVYPGTSTLPFNQTSGSGNDSYVDGSNSTATYGDAGVDYDEFLLEKEKQPLYQAYKLLMAVAFPIIIVLGVVGNILSLIVFGKMASDSTTAALNVFFSALAVSDLGVLLFGALNTWLVEEFSVNLRNYDDSICVIHLFFTYLSGQLSAWYLVALTCLRVGSVFIPHRVHVMYTRSKAKVSVAVITVILMANNSHYFFTFRIIRIVGFDKTCDVLTEYTHLVEIFDWDDLVIASLLPALILVTGNIILSVNLVRSTREARQLGSQSANVTSRQKTTSALIVTVISISVMFLLLTLPLPIMIRILTSDLESYYDDAAKSAWLDFVLLVGQILWNSNSALNFYIYVLTGTKFRALVCALLFPCRKSAATTAESSFRPSSRGSLASPMSNDQATTSTQLEVFVIESTSQEQ